MNYLTRFSLGAPLNLWKYNISSFCGVSVPLHIAIPNRITTSEYEAMLKGGFASPFSEIEAFGILLGFDVSRTPSLRSETCVM
jgi:hypothetical protein